MAITCTDEKNLSPNEFIDALERSTLARRRPVDDLERIKTMIAHADIMLCARDGEKLVGISRALTDFSYCCYLSDLAVDTANHKTGVGKELVYRTRGIAGDRAKFFLMSVPDTMTYYEHIGMTAIPNGWMIDRVG
jgi:predicted N-acetyltransferase YhbS